jgi:hypothetical protein
LGIECEYVVYEDGSQIHFGDLILQLTRAFPELATRESGHRLRLPTGHLLYSDGWYAELATPPEPVQPVSRHASPLGLREPKSNFWTSSQDTPRSAA